MVEDYKKISSMDLEFTHTSENGQKPKSDVTKNCYFIVKEALMNILKHSKATKAGVDLVFSEEHLFLTIWDNGQGLVKVNSMGIGLRSISDRVEKLHGSLNLKSESGFGNRN